LQGCPSSEAGGHGEKQGNEKGKHSPGSLHAAALQIQLFNENGIFGRHRPALVANSLCPEQEKRILRESEVQIENSGWNHLVDSRAGRYSHFLLADLFQRSVYRWLGGYEALNDATRLARDQTFRLMGSMNVYEQRIDLTSAWTSR